MTRSSSGWSKSRGSAKSGGPACLKSSRVSPGAVEVCMPVTASAIAPALALQMPGQQHQAICSCQGQGIT